MILRKKQNNETTSTRISTWNYIKREKLLYFMMLPTLLYFVVYHYLPMFGIVIAFKRFSPLMGILKSPWVGVENFKNLFNSPDFFLVFKNTIVISLLRLAFGFPAPIILSLLINEVRNTSYKRVVQTISYMPHFLSWVIVSGIITTMLSLDGPINSILQIFGVEPKQILIDTRFFKGILVVTGIWKEVGWGTLFYLAAIAGLDVSQYEAATIDGAGRFKQILYVTLPGIKGVVIIMLILNVGGIMNAGFEQVFLLQNDMVRNVSEILDTYIYKIGIAGSNYSFGTAVGLFKCVINMLMIIITNFAAKAVGEDGIW